MSYTPRFASMAPTAPAATTAPVATPANAQQMPASGRTVPAFGAIAMAQSVPVAPTMPTPAMPTPAMPTPGAINGAPVIPATLPANTPATQLVTPATPAAPTTPADPATAQAYKDVAYIMAIAGLKPSRILVKLAASTVRLYWDPARCQELGFDPRRDMVAVCRHAAQTLCGNPEAGYVYAGRGGKNPLTRYGGVEVVVNYAGLAQLAAQVRATRRQNETIPSIGRSRKPSGKTYRMGLMAAEAAKYQR